MLLFRVLDLVVRNPVQALRKHHDGRNARLRDLRRVVQWPARESVRGAADFLDSLIAQLDERVVEQDGRDLPEPVPLYGDVARFGKAFAGVFRVLEHSGEGVCA